MSRKFLTHIDLQGNQLYNALIGNAASSSGLSTTDGSVYFDTTLHKLQVRENGAWVGYYTSTTTLNSITAPTGSLAMNSQKITGLADPTSAQDAATKAYVDAYSLGLDFKQSVLVATQSNLASFTLGASTTATIDGVTVSAGSRVLVKSQTIPSQNGIYVGAYSAPNLSLVRSSDADVDAELTAGTFVYVEGGTSAGAAYVLTTQNVTVGTTGQTWSQFSGNNTTNAGAGLTLTGNVLAVGAGTGITVNTDDVAVNYSALWIGSSNVQNATGTQALTGISGITGGTTLDLLGNTRASSSAGYAVTLTGGANTGTGTGGSLTLKGGANSGASGTGGAVSIEGGAGTDTTGNINIGTVSATNVGIGVAGATTTVTGSVKLPTVGTSGFVKLGTGGVLSADTSTYLTSSTGVTSVNGSTGAVTNIARKATQVGSGSGTTISWSNTWSTNLVTAQVYDTSTSTATLVEVDITATTSAVVATFASTTTLSNYTLVITG